MMTFKLGFERGQKGRGDTGEATSGKGQESGWQGRREIAGCG